MADGGPSPETVLFVGGFVTGLFLLAAGLAYTAAPGVRTIAALSMALAGLGGVVLLASVVTAGVFWYANRDPKREDGAAKNAK